MGKNSKPWMNYQSAAAEREYPQPIRKNRSFRWALFWLIFGGYVGAHRFYLWDYKEARRIILLYLAVNIVGLIIFVERLGNSDDTMAIAFSVLIWLLIIGFELPKLRRRVAFKNKEYDLL